MIFSTRAFDSYFKDSSSEQCTRVPKYLVIVAAGRLLAFGLGWLQVLCAGRWCAGLLAGRGLGWMRICVRGWAQARGVFGGEEARSSIAGKGAYTLD